MKQKSFLSRPMATAKTKRKFRTLIRMFAVISGVVFSFSLAHAQAPITVAQLKELKELPKSGQVTGAITKLSSAGISSPVAVIELDGELVCEVSFPLSGAFSPSSKVKIEKDSNTIKVIAESSSGKSIIRRIVRTLTVGETVAVRGIFVKKGNGVKLTGQLAVR